MEHLPEIDPKMAEQLVSLAGSYRHAGVLLNQAVEHLIAEMKIQKGLADIAAGKTVPHEKVGAWIASWDSQSPLPCPGPE